MRADDTPEPSPETHLPALVFGAILAVLGVVGIAAPSLLAKRFQFALEHERAIQLTLLAAGPAMLAMGAAALLTSSRWFADRPRASAWLTGGLVVLGYVSLTTCLSDWLVDDAAITFAYSKNLAAGHGLVIRPGHAPEEGYSNTLWMLILAAARWMGADIAVTAKRGCVAFGALAVAVSFFVCHQLTGKRVRFGLLALGATICLGAPFLIWSSSGLEHSLQAAMFAIVVVAPLAPRFERLLTAGALSALVLTRPEAPMIVVFVGAVLILRDPSRERVLAALRRYWPVLAIPGATWLALMAFRLAYFHDPMSNPYYAKAADANWLRVANFVGRSWTYLTGWLADARTWMIFPFVLIAPFRRASVSYQLAVALCLAQLLFILFVGGDWMGCYRFVSPALPILAVLIVSSVSEAGKRWSRLSSPLGCLILVWFLGLGTLTQLVLFRSSPTTPASVVAEIGTTFVELGHRLGIEHPSLAHHDAGGTSYETDIDLVDLGGLGDRIVAKHITDRDFMRKYIFEERRPTFVFGSTKSFAAGATKFHLMPQFDEQYVPLRFAGRPLMSADLCHVRRDAIHSVPGVTEVKDGATTKYWQVEPVGNVSR